MKRNNIIGTTSACAENTRGWGFRARGLGNYLRVRGEYHLIHSNSFPLRELPPRARRILGANWQEDLEKGTTSACAENTYVILGRRFSPRNYLRVRGEYITADFCTCNHVELPPRARRIHCDGIDFPTIFGTTSACAENTTNGTTSVASSTELPPRARRIPHSEPFKTSSTGTTSACAENTNQASIYADLGGNYLRVRGEYCFGLPVC